MKTARDLLEQLNLLSEEELDSVLKIGVPGSKIHEVLDVEAEEHNPELHEDGVGTITVWLHCEPEGEVIQ